MPRWEPDAERRLVTAALARFDELGYDRTTVAAIAEAAGLTKRTFFRYFADKREVLFKGAGELQDTWVAGITAAPQDASPLIAVSAGLAAVAELFADRHAFAAGRARVIAANPELQERELIKLQVLAAAVAAALVRRAVAADTADLAAQAGVTVFHLAFARWIAQDDPAALQDLIDQTVELLREVTSA